MYFDSIWGPVLSASEGGDFDYCSGFHVILSFKTFDDLFIIHHCCIQISYWYSINHNSVHWFMDFEPFKYSAPDVLLDMIEFACSGGFFLSFKLETEALCQLTDSNNAWAVGGVDVKAINRLLASFSNSFGWHCED